MIYSTASSIGGQRYTIVRRGRVIAQLEPEWF